MRFVTTTTIPSVVDTQEVRREARAVLLAMREVFQQNDEQIRATYLDVTLPHADRVYEQSQIEVHGCVAVPAHYLKAEVRRMLEAGE